LRREDNSRSERKFYKDAKHRDVWEMNGKYFRELGLGKESRKY
jgi:hypothetical protein